MWNMHVSEIIPVTLTFIFHLQKHKEKKRVFKFNVSYAKFLKKEFLNLPDIKEVKFQVMSRLSVQITAPFSKCWSFNPLLIKLKSGSVKN